MGIDSVVQFIAVTLEVFLVDLLLSGDNALVIALACRSLPPQARRQVMVAGTGIAIALRVVLTLLASFLLRVPVLKLLGGIALAMIAVRLTVADQNASRDEPALVGAGGFAGALVTVLVADLVMSADNVLALAAVARGRVTVLVLGLLLSLPLLMFGSWFVTNLLRRYPCLTPLGGALLGWLAGDIAISDPLYARSLERQSPALSVEIPILLAVYVLAQSRIIERSRASAAALRPAPTPKVRAARQSKIAIASVATPALGPRRASPGMDADVRTFEERRLPTRASYRWLMAPMTILLVMGLAFVVLSSNWMPTAAAPNRYECSTNGFTIYYRMGASRIRLTAGSGSASGTVLPNNDIDWGNLHASSLRLGFVPPTRVVYADAKTLRVEGGMFGELTCHAR